MRDHLSKTGSGELHHAPSNDKREIIPYRGSLKSKAPALNSTAAVDKLKEQNQQFLDSGRRQLLGLHREASSTPKFQMARKHHLLHPEPAVANYIELYDEQHNQGIPDLSPVMQIDNENLLNDSFVSGSQREIQFSDGLMCTKD